MLIGEGSGVRMRHGGTRRWGWRSPPARGPAAVAAPTRGASGGAARHWQGLQERAWAMIPFSNLNVALLPLPHSPWWV